MLHEYPLECVYVMGVSMVIMMDMQHCGLGQHIQKKLEHETELPWF